MQEKLDFEKIKNNPCKKFVWVGSNTSYLLKQVTKHAVHVTYQKMVFKITITRVMDVKWIEIERSEAPMYIFYELMNEVRRFEYLFDGAFYNTTQCKMDDMEIVDAIRCVDLGYFQYAKRKRRILLNLRDMEYQKYFCKWLKLEKDLGIINQMVLYAGNINGLPVDVRISMLTECFEALVRKLEIRQLIQKVYPRTLENCMNAILIAYGEPVFTAEKNNWHTLVRRIVKTRNKVFHVDSRKKDVLNGPQSGFYAVKLEWLYRYIVWRMLGYDRNRLDDVLKQEIDTYNANYPQLIFDGAKRQK